MELLKHQQGLLQQKQRTRQELKDVQEEFELIKGGLGIPGHPAPATTTEEDYMECWEKQKNLEQRLAHIDEQLQIVERELAIRSEDTAADADPVPPEVYSHAPDYAEITFRGKTHFPTPAQRHIVRVMHKAYKDGHPARTQESIADEAGHARRLMLPQTPTSRSVSCSRPERLIPPNVNGVAR